MKRILYLITLFGIINCTNAQVFKTIGNQSIIGNLGIGMTIPSFKFHIRGSNSNSDKMTLGTTSTGNFALTSADGNAYGLFAGVSGTGRAWLQVGRYDSNTAYDLTLQAAGGNVGIGTTIPTSKLDISAVNGEGIRIGKINDIGNFTVPLDGLAARYNIDFTGYRDIALDQIGARISALRFNCHIANSALVQKTGLAFYTNPIGINTGTTDLLERMRITPEGKIGIGTDIPDEMLTVKVIIHAREVKIDLTGPLADFVFKTNYNLIPLHEVEQFIKTNNHLPEIPSAAEVSKNGLSIGEMQNKLLQKIEELTLYVIEQQKQIEELKASLNSSQGGK